LPGRLRFGGCKTFRAVPERGRNLEAVPMTIYALVTGTLWKAISVTVFPPNILTRMQAEAERVGS
jgi:hypothetical protein